MPTTQTNYCPFCSTFTELHPLVHAGVVHWACKTVTNPDLPAFTCYSSWEKLLVDPLKLTLSDF